MTADCPSYCNLVESKHASISECTGHVAPDLLLFDDSVNGLPLTDVIGGEGFVHKVEAQASEVLMGLSKRNVIDRSTATFVK